MHAPEHAGTALVLGGGGSTGNAWVIGVVAGLADAGLDVTHADLIVGTSSGSTAAAQLTSGTSPDRLLTAILESRPPAGLETGRPVDPARPVIDHLARTDLVIASSGSAAEMRRSMGASAIELDDASGGAQTGRWRAIVAGRLGEPIWPEREILITAVDADTGESVVFDRRSGVDLVDAIAASTSSGAAYRIGDRRYIDGGYRRNENADLAAGDTNVLVLSPFGGRSRMPAEWGMDLATQVAELRSAGSVVETVFPDPAADGLFGVRGMDLSLRPAAARTGSDQGRALGERLVSAGFRFDLT